MLHRSLPPSPRRAMVTLLSVPRAYNHVNESSGLSSGGCTMIALSEARMATSPPRQTFAPCSPSDQEFAFREGDPEGPEGQRRVPLGTDAVDSCSNRALVRDGIASRASPAFAVGKGHHRPTTTISAWMRCTILVYEEI